MRLRSVGSSIWAVAGLALVALFAATGGAARASCYSGARVVPAATVSAFLANPGQALQQNPNGGGQLISTLRELVASDPATLQPILALLADANTEQATALGTALGQASQICLKTDQPYATQIQQALAATGSQPAILAFAAVTGDRPIGEVGGGAGDGGGGGGGGGGPITTATSTFTGSSGPPATSPSGGGAASFSSSGFTATAFSASSFTLTTTTTTTTAATAGDPVSPTRP